MNLNSQNKRKLLFAYLKTGGGHLAPAKALAAYFEKHYKDEVDIKLIDGFDKSTKYTRFIIEDGYRILQGKVKWLYELIYAFHKIKIISEISSYLVALHTIKYLNQVIQVEKPDKIVLFHFFLIKPVYKIVNKLNLNITIVTLVTDPFIAPTLWFLRKDQNFIVFSKELRDYCVKKGINSRNISVFNFVIDDKYSNAATTDDIASYKRKLGFNHHKVLLILGGGDGIPNGINILKYVLESKSDFEIAIVCGKNKELYDQAQKINANGKHNNLKIYGYVDFIYELISISDIVISKCGASTAMELLISKKFQIINTYLWEQEKGNVDFLINNNLGIYEKRINKLPLIIDKMFTEKNTLEKYQQNITSFHFKNGLSEVASFLLKH